MYWLHFFLNEASIIYVVMFKFVLSAVSADSAEASAVKVTTMHEAQKRHRSKWKWNWTESMVLSPLSSALLYSLELENPYSEEASLERRISQIRISDQYY